MKMSAEEKSSSVVGKLKKEFLHFEKNEKGGRTFKDTLKDLGETSTLHGISKIASSRQIVVKVLWCLLFLGTFTVFIMQLIQLFKTYYSYPVQTTVSLDFNSIAFPAITLCNINPVKNRQLDLVPTLKGILDKGQSQNYFLRKRREAKMQTKTNDDKDKSFSQYPTKNEWKRAIKELSERHPAWFSSYLKSSNGEKDKTDDIYGLNDDVEMNTLKRVFEKYGKGQRRRKREVLSTSLSNTISLSTQAYVSSDNTQSIVQDSSIATSQLASSTQPLSSEPILTTSIDASQSLSIAATLNTDTMSMTTTTTDIGLSTALSGSVTSTVPIASTLLLYSGDSTSYISEITYAPVSSGSESTSMIVTNIESMSSDNELTIHPSMNTMSVWPESASNDMSVTDHTLSVNFSGSISNSDIQLSSSSALSQWPTSEWQWPTSEWQWPTSEWQWPTSENTNSDLYWQPSEGFYSGNNWEAWYDYYSNDYFPPFNDYGDSWYDWYYYNTWEDGNYGGSFLYDQIHSKKDEWDERIENFRTAFKNESLETRKLIGHQKEDMVFAVSFAGRVQNVSHFHHFTSTEYGNCYTMSSPKYVAWRSGPSHGFKLTLNLEIDEYMPNFSTGYGIRIVFHEPGTHPLPAHEGVTLSPGTETNIGLRMVRISRLQDPHGDCVDGSEFMKRYHKKYSISSCYEFCRIQRTIQECKCLPVEAPDGINLSNDLVPVCNASEKAVKACLLEVDLRFDNGVYDCDCRGPCNETVYAKTMSSTYWPTDDYLEVLIAEMCQIRNTSDWMFLCSMYTSLPSWELDRFRYNFVRVLIYFEDLNYETITEEPLYESVRFLSDIGGAMGLFLGASVLSFVEVVQLLLELILILKNKYLNNNNTRVSTFSP